MKTLIYAAKVICESNDGDGRNKIQIGIFSTRERAEMALENFVEGTLEMEYPHIRAVKREVEEFELDKSIDEMDQAIDLGDGSIPF